MDKLNNINACMSTEFVPSCEELVSFSGNDIENLVNGSLRCGNGCDNSISYSLRIKLFGNCNCGCNCNNEANRLILDNLGSRYSYVNGSASLDNRCFDPDFGLNGVYTEIYASNDSRLLKLDLVDNSRCSGVDYGCIRNLNRGFNLSQIMENIGDFNLLNQTCMGSTGNICINQRSYFINRCGKTYVVFKFKIVNNGNDLVQKILFKDVFPDNVFINQGCVFLNECKLCSREIFLDKNRMVIKLPDLEVGREVDLMIVGMLCGNSIRENNFATVSYVSGVFKCENKRVIDVCQKMSNMKII